jgi:hypothetical protein
MHWSTAAVVAAVALATGGALHAGGQTRGRVAPTPALTAGQFRQIAPGDPAYARSLQAIRYEPPPSADAPMPSGRDRRDRRGGVGWWPWYPAVAAGGTGSDAAALAIPRDAGPPGGLQLDVQPWRAQVFVDGVYEGRAEDFRGYYQHLALAPGLHVIAIVADEHEPLVLELLVSPGQTLTYRGSLTYVSR